MRRKMMGALLLLGGCVPNGPASSSDGGIAMPGSAAPRPRSSITPPGAVRPELRSAAASASSLPVARTISPPLGPGFEDNFERTVLGPDWHVSHP